MITEFRINESGELVGKVETPQWDEMYTKADMVNMLEELKAEIEELKNEPACCHHFVRGIRRSSEVIQEKIDKLKETKKAKHEITAELNLKNFILELREVSQTLNECADKLYMIKIKYDK